METFEEKVERYMQCDKRTLAEMLAMKDLSDLNKQIQTVPYYDNQLDPNIVRPTRTVPYGPNIPPNYGDWVVTCSTN
jgi:hypothetical protein